VLNPNPSQLNINQSVSQRKHTIMKNTFAIKTEEGYLATQGNQTWFQDEPKGWAEFVSKKDALNAVPSNFLPDYEVVEISEGKQVIKFQDAFDSYACIGESISVGVNGITYTAVIESDHNSHLDDDDCHNTDQNVTGCNDEQQAKLIKARAAWCKDEWCYCSIVIHANKKGTDLGQHIACLGNVELNYPESDNSKLTDVANELLVESIEQAEENLKEIIAKLNS
jgi:hypothetical protein